MTAPIDPSNPVVALCAEGMALEGTPELARERFQRAWMMRRGHAEAVADERVRSFLPSLLLNVGDSLLANRRAAEAQDAAERARVALAALPDDGYRAFVARGIEGLLRRLHAGTEREASAREHDGASLPVE